MKVLVVGTFTGVGGHERYCRAWGDALAGAGLDVERCDLRAYPSPWWTRARAARKLDRAARATARGLATAARVRRARFDVAHFQLLTPMVDRWWLSWALAGRPGVLTVHNVEPHAPGLESRPAFVRPILRAMARLVVHTEANRARLAALYPEVADRVRVVPHAVWEPPARLDRAAARRRLGIPEDGPVVLFFGGLRANKGLRLLVDAVGVLRASGAEAPRVLVAGGLPAGERFDPYADAIAAAGVRDRFDVRLGFVPEADVPAYFGASDVVALPYEPSFQAQSGVLAEAYAYGVPVVATDVGGVGETLRRDGTGRVAEERTPRAYAEALGALCADAEARAAMRARMGALAAGAYAWSRVGERTREIYAELVRDDADAAHAAPPARWKESLR